MRDLNQLTDQFTESVIRNMTRVCLEAGGINLSQGFPDWDTPPEIIEAAVRALRSGVNQYAITWGQPELRRAIAERVAAYNGFTCDPETQITVCCGATEGMIATLKAIINPGDEVIIFEPFYENYGPDTLLSGAIPRYVTLNAPEWDFDPDQLAAAFNNRTKAIIINTPNNPTGKVFVREELQFVADLCQKWGCYLVTDEIYEYILYDGAEHVSPASLAGMAEHAITINSLSKTYSATGWRVGWIIAPPKATAAIRKVHDFLTVGAPAPLQAAGVTALTMPESYYAGLSGRYRQARRFLHGVLQELDMRPTLPRGAYYIITENPALMAAHGCDDDFAWALKLVELTGVASVPGSSFYADPAKGRHQVRWCFCKKMETLEAAAQGLRRLA